MITEKDLQEAIAECNGERNPNANTCIKLAAFLTIQREMFGSPEEKPTYSFAESPQVQNPVFDTVTYDSGTEFSDAVYGMKTDELMIIMDELMTALQVINPRLYAGVMRKIED